MIPKLGWIIVSPEGVPQEFNSLAGMWDAPYPTYVTMFSTQQDAEKAIRLGKGFGYEVKRAELKLVIEPL